MKLPRVRWGAILSVVDRMALTWLSWRGKELAPIHAGASESRR